MWSMIGGLKSRLDDTLSRDTTTFRSTWHEIAVNYRVFLIWAGSQTQTAFNGPLQDVKDGVCLSGVSA